MSFYLRPKNSYSFLWIFNKITECADSTATIFYGAQQGAVKDLIMYKQR